MIDLLDFPPHLDRRGEAPRKPRAPRWKKMPVRGRPKGERWERAERWEVFIMPQVGISWTDGSGKARGLATGLRRIWVVEAGVRVLRAFLHDGDTFVRVPIETWRQMQRNAKQVQ